MSLLFSKNGYMNCISFKPGQVMCSTCFPRFQFLMILGSSPPTETRTQNMLNQNNAWLRGQLFQLLSLAALNLVKLDVLYYHLVLQT